MDRDEPARSSRKEIEEVFSRMIKEFNETDFNHLEQDDWWIVDGDYTFGIKEDGQVLLMSMCGGEPISWTPVSSADEAMDLMAEWAHDARQNRR